MASSNIRSQIIEELRSKFPRARAAWTATATQVMADDFFPLRQDPETRLWYPFVVAQAVALGYDDLPYLSPRGARLAITNGLRKIHLTHLFPGLPAAEKEEVLTTLKSNFASVAAYDREQPTADLLVTTEPPHKLHERLKNAANVPPSIVYIPKQQRLVEMSVPKDSLLLGTINEALEDGTNTTLDGTKYRAFSLENRQFLALKEPDGRLRYFERGHAVPNLAALGSCRETVLHNSLFGIYPELEILTGKKWWEKRNGAQAYPPFLNQYHAQISAERKDVPVWVICPRPDGVMGAAVTKMTDKLRPDFQVPQGLYVAQGHVIMDIAMTAMAQAILKNPGRSEFQKFKVDHPTLLDLTT